MIEQNNNKIMVLELQSNEKKHPLLYTMAKNKLEKNTDNIIFVDVSKKNETENITYKLLDLKKEEGCSCEVNNRCEHSLYFKNKTVVLNYDDNLYIKINPLTRINFLAPIIVPHNGSPYSVSLADADNFVQNNRNLTRLRVEYPGENRSYINSLDNGFNMNNNKVAYKDAQYRCTYNKDNKEFDIYDEGKRESLNVKLNIDTLCRNIEPSYWSNIKQTFNNDTKTLDKIKSLFGINLHGSGKSNVCFSCNDTTMSLNDLINNEQQKSI